MSLIMFEGFEGIDAASELTNLGFSNVSMGAAMSIITGRASRGKALRQAYTNSNGAFRFYWSGVADEEIIIGCAFRFSGSSSNNVGLGIWADSNHSSVYWVLQASVQKVHFYRTWGVSSSLVGSSGVLSANKWHYVELRGKSHNTAGRCVGWVNGNQIVDYTGDTYYSSTVLNHIRYHTSNYCQLDIDDLYILRYNDGTPPQDVLKSCRVDQVLVDGAGNYTQFSPSAGANYQCVDDDPFDTADYVEGDADGEKDSYTIVDVPTQLDDNGIHAVQVTPMTARTEAFNNLDIVPFLRKSSSDYEASALDIESTTYIKKRGIWRQDPSDSTDWTKAKINACEIGAKLLRSTTTTTTSTTTTGTTTTGGSNFRFLIDDMSAGYRGYCVFAELELREQVEGADKFNNAIGTASASSEFDGTTLAEDAVDDDSADVWHSAYDAVETNHWWRFDFDTLKVDPVQYTIKARPDAFADEDTPIGWRLQKWNYVTQGWDTIHTVTGESDWGNAEKRKYTLAGVTTTTTSTTSTTTTT